LFAARGLIEWNVLVDADILRQAEHALGHDVTQDFVRAASDAVARRTNPLLSIGTLGRRDAPVADDAAHVLKIHAEGPQILHLFRRDVLADRAFRAGRLALGQGGERPEAGELQPLRLHIPVCDALTHGAIADRGLTCDLGLPRKLDQFAGIGIALAATHGKAL